MVEAMHTRCIPRVLEESKWLLTAGTDLDGVDVEHSDDRCCVSISRLSASLCGVFFARHVVRSNAS